MIATIVFLLAAAFVAYVLVGYPMLLALLTRLGEHPLRRGTAKPIVSVLVAVRNGERYLRAKIESLLALRYPPERLEIIIVSDGSEDSTDAIAREYAARGVILIRVPHGGKAAALNAGMARAQGEILFFTDVRQRMDRDSLANLVSCFEDPTVGVVSGELMIVQGESMEEAHVGLYWEYEKWIRKRQSRLGSMLGATGAIYAMRRSLAIPLPPGTLLDDVYLPLAAFLRGYRIVLDDSARAYDMPASLETEFRRKVRTLAGVYQVTMALPQILIPGKKWLHFVSHKLARLMLPFALIVLLVTGALLPWPWNIAVTIAQIGFYALAMVDPLLGSGSILKRLTSLARTFTVLMLATLSAAAILVRPGHNFWKPSRPQ